MVKSIQHFEENSIKKFEKLEDEFFKNPKDFASYVIGLTEELHNLGLRMIQESLETMNQLLRDSSKRGENWTVDQHNAKQLITSLGTVTYTKTLFKNKKTGATEYLLDRILGLDKHERMTEDAFANLLEEAVQTSYRRGGEEVSLTAEVSKQTVKNKLHELVFPQNEEVLKEKKVVDYLYIDADEDHVSLQFREKRGDLVTNENHQKNNCIIAKLVYVYEGIEKEAPQSKRHKLVNPYYFCRVCDGEANIKFWDEIYRYLDNHYDLSKVKKIYINSDGGGWIKSGMRRIAGVVHVLDEFHLEKYMIKLTSHMQDSTDDARKEIYRCIRKGTKEEFKEIVERLRDCLKTEAGNKRLDDSRDYILSNWTAARLRLLHREGIVGCSTEGHVSHILSSRVSSRPMGWSITGISNMAELIAYHKNGGNMLKLVRYQKQVNQVPMAAGAEYDVLSAGDILASETNRHGELGKYLEIISHHMSLQSKKQAFFQAQIWGL